MNQSYVLITAARNEGAYLPKTVESVLAQTVRPVRWVIVSDGSTDDTDTIAHQSSMTHSFIEFIRKEPVPAEIGFASKVHALDMGYGHLKNFAFEFVGHLDGDVSFGPRYYESVMAEFSKNARLGIAGGFIYERDGAEFGSRPSNTVVSVAGAVQLFRRECYEEIGGLAPIPVGGEDWYAEIVARMKGWEVRAFPELKVFHHKKGSEVRGGLRENFRQGVVDYSLGTHPIFEIFKVLRRLREKPYLVGSGARLAGFTWPYLRGTPRSVPDNFVGYLRREQMGRLKGAWKSLDQSAFWSR